MNEPLARHRDVQRIVETLRDAGSPDGAARDEPDASSQRPALTSRQWEVLHGVAAGATNHQIGHRLGVSEATVRKHLEHVFERLQVSSRTEAAMAVSAYLDPAHPWGRQPPPPEPSGDGQPEIPPQVP